MITRRTLLVLASSFVVRPTLAADTGPVPPISAIYNRIVASYDDDKRTNVVNGAFIWLHDENRRHYFSARTAKLWRDVDRKTPKGYQGPLGFDPVTNSQDPRVRAFDTAIEKWDTRAATVDVRLSEQAGPTAYAAIPRNLVRYDMAFENGHWLIDDIHGTNDTEWSVRKIMTDYLAWCARPDHRKLCR